MGYYSRYFPYFKRHKWFLSTLSIYTIYKKRQRCSSLVLLLHSFPYIPWPYQVFNPLTSQPLSRLRVGVRYQNQTATLSSGPLLVVYIMLNCSSRLTINRMLVDGKTYATYVLCTPFHDEYCISYK